MRPVSGVPVDRSVVVQPGPGRAPLDSMRDPELVLVVAEHPALGVNRGDAPSAASPAAGSAPGGRLCGWTRSPISLGGWLRRGDHRVEGVIMSTALEEFASDPFAPHSAQFPLGSSTSEQGDFTPPSRQGIRPWNLQAMRPARQQGDPVREVFFYDHDEQVAIDAKGRYLTVEAATANKVTSSDGDEGPSEDFTYDFCPDFPYPA